ncbi:hypothetical protein [Dethiothermospora halolimnae]|uniref:hypothetical protein n=1 Tax=Dethiothermospora halolimnae TaxID=3114390 RepID=UPI003CCBEAB5
MAHIDKNIDTKTNIKETNERRINELLHLMEKHTRTDRHLEQHSDISELESLKHTLDLQKDREKKIEHLKELIIQGHNNSDEAKHLKRNYHYTENYLRHHEGHMDPATIKFTKEKQKHREEQMKYLQ